MIKFYDVYTQYVEQKATKLNPISVFRNKVQNTYVQGLIFVLAFLIALTPPFAFVAILIYAVVILAVSKIDKQSSALAAMYTLAFNFNVNDLEHYNVDQSQLMDEEIDETDTDKYPSLVEFIVRGEEIEKRFDQSAIDRQVSEMQNQFLTEYKPVVTQQIKDANNKFYDIKEIAVRELSDCQAIAKDEYERLKSEYVLFGEAFTDNPVFNMTFTFGEKDFINETVDIGLRNIIIRPCADEKLMQSFLRLMVVNAFCNVLTTKVSIHVIDPNNMGRALVCFCHDKLGSRFNIVQNNISDVITTYAEQAQKNMQLAKGQTVAEYNQQCLETGRDSIHYTILFILSQSDEMEKTEELKSLFQYSASTGIYLWVVSDKLEPTKDTFIFNKPYENIQNPIRRQDDSKWCMEFSEKVVKRLDDFRPKGLLWKDFMAHAHPLDKKWDMCADDNLDIYPGFQNGDPDLAVNYPLGNGGNVHALVAGTTGAGKSIFVHHIIQTIAQMYSPREVELWLCDFKGTEFQFYMATQEHPKVLPHIKACLCTSDGDFATSLFHRVREVCDDRFEQMKVPNNHRDWLKYDDGENIPNFDNAKNWNKYWRERAKQKGDNQYIENCYPRILLLCDEFQAIFQKSSPENLDKIRVDMTQIAKLGRAANVNMMFCSQSLQGALNADTQKQFSMRIALRCEEDVSSEVLGSPVAGRDMPKFGQLYIRATGIPKDDLPRITTPFISAEGEIPPLVAELADLAEQKHMPKKQVITYIESDKYNISVLEDHYKQIKEMGKLPADAELFLIGERMAYSENKVPDNIFVARRNDENFLCVASDYTDFIYLFNTFIANLHCSPNNPTIVCNSQVEDLAYVVHAEDVITKPEFKAFLDAPIDAMIKWIQGVLQKRAETKKTDPLWIFLLGWDKGRGIGVDPDLTCRNGIASILKTGGTLGVHIVIMNTTSGGMATNIIAGCKYKFACKCSQDDSMNILSSKIASKEYDMKTGWVFLQRDGEMTRDKLYISEIDREVAPKELVL